MASQGTKFTVGLFVACGIGIALIAFVWLGMSRFLEKGSYYAVYFNESVQGLDIDSAVKYRGVSIGRVDSIGVAPDSKLIQVVLKIESGQSLTNDIVAQLKVVGITGSMFVELDRKKKGEPDRSPPLSFPSEFPIVASKPSDISQLLQGVDDVLNKIKSLDLKGISDKIILTLDNVNLKITDVNMAGISDKVESTLDNVNKAIGDAEVKKVSENVQASLGSLNEILSDQRLESIIGSVDEAAKSLNTLIVKAEDVLSVGGNSLARIENILADKQDTIKAAFENFRKAIENANIFLEKGALLAGGADKTLNHLKRHLIVMVQNLERASDNLNRLIELIADHPPQLLFGEPPKPRKLESNPPGRE